MKWIHKKMERGVARRFFFRFFIIIMLLLSTGYGQKADAKEAGLSLDACIELALKHNQDIEGARIFENMAASKLTQADALQYPEVKIGANAGYISELTRIGLDGMTVDIPGGSTITVPGREMEMGEHEKTDISLSLTQPVYTGGRIKSGIRKAAAGVDIANHQMVLEKQQVVNQVTTLYFQFAKALEYKKVVIQSLEQIEAHLKDAENLVAQGMLLKSDLYPIEIRRLDTELMIVKAENAISRAEAGLSERLGLSPEKELAVKVDWDHLPPWPIPSEIFRKKGSRQETMIAQKQIEMAEAEIEISEGSLKPEIGLTASGHYGYPGFNTRSPDWDTWWQAGVMVSFTIFDMDRKKAERNTAFLNKTRLEKAKESIDHKISLDQINARLAYEESQRTMDITRKKVSAALENYRLKNDNFKVGMATNTDFLDAHTELVRARADEVLLSAETRIAWSDFVRAMGQEDWTKISEKGENDNE